MTLHPSVKGARLLQPSNDASFLAHRIVERTDAKECRIFEVADAGASLVTTGLAVSLRFANIGTRPLLGERRRISIMELPVLMSVLQAKRWIEMKPGVGGIGPMQVRLRHVCNASDQDCVVVAPFRATSDHAGIICLVYACWQTGSHRHSRRSLEVEIGNWSTTPAAPIPFSGRQIGLSIHQEAESPAEIGAVSIDTSARIVALDGVAEKLCRQPAASLIGRRLCSFASDCQCPIHAALRSGAAAEAIWPLAAAGRPNSLSPQITICPLRTGTTGANAAAIVLVKPGAAASRGEHCDRDAELSAFASHEMRAPLTTLRMASELLLSDEMTADKRGELLTVIMRQTARLENLTQTLIDNLRLGPDNRSDRGRRNDLSALIEEVLADFRCRQTHEIVLLSQDDLGWTSGDPERLRVVLTNLVGNAVKYAPAGSVITLVAGRDQRALCITVRDQGPGIAQEHLPFLFDRFYRIETGTTATRGFGLGLFIARRLVEAEGGRIWAESEPGCGSCFTFTLPLQPAHGVRRPASVPSRRMAVRPRVPRRASRRQFPPESTELPERMGAAG